MGGQALITPQAIEQRLDSVSFFVEHLFLRDELREYLKVIYDLEECRVVFPMEMQTQKICIICANHWKSSLGLRNFYEGCPPTTGWNGENCRADR